MNATAQHKITAARTDLICSDPFFGTLALSLIPKSDPTCNTAWTDGRHLGYNPTFIESLSHAEAVGLIKHEVLHCSQGHIFRRDGRDMKQWNIACDLAIHEYCGTLPKGALVPTVEQRGKSAEWIYSRLPKPDPNDKRTPAAGEVRDAPTGTDEDGNTAPTEGEWKQKTVEALQSAKMKGSIPGGLARLVEESLEKRVDVRSLLLRFMVERTRADYSWNTPSRRHVHLGIFLPSLQSISMGEVAIMVDTSGSVDAASLSYARRIVEDVIEECSPVATTVWYSDAKVCRVDRFEQSEPLTWTPAGGGGTDFRPVLKAIEDEGTAVCVICITDLYGSLPDIAPSMPTLWLCTTGQVCPFGETIPLPQ